MESMDGYDYSLTGHHLKPFMNPLKDEPFIGEMEDTYGTLSEFKEHIATWSFRVNRFKNYIFLRYRFQGTTTYMPWNIKEKVMLIKEHNRDYVVLVLREVDNFGEQGDHSH